MHRALLWLSLLLIASHTAGLSLPTPPQTQPAAPITKRILTLDILSANIGRELAALASHPSRAFREAKLITVHLALLRGFHARASADISAFQQLELDFLAGGPQPAWMLYPRNFYVMNQAPQQWGTWNDPVFDDLHPENLERKEE
ncbi:MAG: hypothetical protein Q9201_000432, partial [Fulgogasparrea decipioides]